MIVRSRRSGRRREAQGSGDAGTAGQGQAGQTSQGLFAPGREPNSRSGAVTTVTLAIQVPPRSAATCANARRLRLLPVTRSPPAPVLGWQSLRMQTDHMAWPSPAAISALLDPVRGTHKGHRCQEGIRIWPGDYACRRAGLTVLLDLPRSCPGLRAARPGGQAGAPAAAQRRGRTSLRPASGGRSSRARKGRLRLEYQGSRACSRCWADGVVSQAPIRRRASVRAAAMTMCPGPGCSVMRSSAALAPAHAAGASLPGA